MIESVMEIVREASGLMVREGFAVEQKGGCENIVTSSDVAVQNFLCTRFKQLIPGCGFICEEEEHHDPDKEYVWIIDPIDGTANYSRGIDHCTISVALMKAGVVILGVVYSPWRDEMFHAEKGKGAFLDGRPVHCSGRSFENSLLCTAMSTYRKEFAPLCNDIIMETYASCNDIRRFGTASSELCIIASGQCELYFELRLQPWDYAAGNLILEEAGGKVTNLDGELPSYRHPDIVVGANTAENHARLLEIVRKHIDRIPYTD